MLPDPDAHPAMIGTREVVLAMRRYWLLIVACTVGAAVVIAGLTVMFQPKTFQSTATVLVNQEGPEDLIIDPVEGDTLPERVIQNEATFAQSSTVQNRAEETLGFEADISATSSAVADVLELTANEDSAQRAQLVAAAYSDAYLTLRVEADQARFDQATAAVESQIASLREELDDTTNAAERDRLLARIEDYERAVNDLRVSADAANGGVVMVAEADLPDGPVSPKPLRNGLIGAVLGLAIGMTLAVARFSTDDRIRSAAGLEATLPEIRLLGEVPATDRGESRRDAAPYRIVATTIRTRVERRNLRSVLVVGIGGNSHTGPLVAHLATAAAQSGQKTIAVDAAIATPSLHKMFDLSPGPGMFDVLSGTSVPWDACRPVDADPNLQVLTSGSDAAADPDLLFGGEARGLIQTLESLETGVLTIVAGPDFHEGGLDMAAVVDAVVLVAPERAHASDVRNAIRQLDRADIETIGVIFAKAGRG